MAAWSKQIFSPSNSPTAPIPKSLKICFNKCFGANKILSCNQDEKARALITPGSKCLREQCDQRAYRTLRAKNTQEKQAAERICRKRLLLPVHMASSRQNSHQPPDQHSFTPAVVECSHRKTCGAGQTRGRQTPSFLPCHSEAYAHYNAQA